MRTNIIEEHLEQLVTNDTGGELFEHFNNPGTDITIDGIEIQIKATDSVSYIASVDDEIPVIVTSEVAEKTDSIDGGYTNAELTTTVEQALGDGVIDAKGTAVDSIDFAKIHFISALHGTGVG